MCGSSIKYHPTSHNQQNQSSPSTIMRRVTLLFLFHGSLAQFFNIDECVIDYRSLENMWDKKLVHDLESCSDRSRPPPWNSTDPMKIRISFIANTFRYRSNFQEFRLFTWTLTEWQDDRLKWDPKNYDGINIAQLTSNDIWGPHIRLLNNIDDQYDIWKFYYDIPCEIRSSGLVRCVNWVVYIAKCVADLRTWPFDEHNCTLEFSTYSESKNKQRLEFGPAPLMLVEGNTGAEWDIVDHVEESQEKLITVKLKLRRRGDILGAILIYPSVILTALTLSALLLDARRAIRLLLLSFSLLCHFKFLSELAEDFPKHSKESPRLLLYYRGSFLMTAISIGVSFALNRMCRKQSACPNWINSFNEFVFTKMKVFWPRWERQFSGEVDTNKLVHDWADFSSFANVLWIGVSVVVYTVMFSVFIPHPIPVDVKSHQSTKYL